MKPAMCDVLPNAKESPLMTTDLCEAQSPEQTLL